MANSVAQMANTQTYISLREVGRRLGIPPSTVVYYKDRFASHIPSEGGQGRRMRYPEAVLDIFRSIREMFDNNWSAEQIEEALAKKQKPPVPPFGSGDPAKAAREAARVPQPDIPPVPSVVLEQLAHLAKGQADLGAAIKGLARDMEAMRKDQAAAAEDRLGRIERLETELEGVRRMLFDLGDRVAGKGNGADKGADKPGREKKDKAAKGGVGEGPRSRAASGGLAPSEAFLSRPLVIRTAQGEYLGVLGGGRKHFTLGDFITLMERNISGRRSIRTKWERRSEQWVLVVAARDVETGSEQSILLVVRKTITPSKNVVTEIVRLNIDGSDVPDSLLLSLFKQVRDEFSGES